MWKVLIILVVLGTVWSRTLDSTVKDVTTRTRPRGREDNTESDPSVQCTDCNEKIQTDGKVVDEKIFKPAIQVQGRNKVDKDTSKKRNGHHRRNRNKRKRERNVKRTRKPYISIGGVKIRINDQPTNSGRNVTIPNNKYDSLKIDQHIMGGSENRFTNDEDVNIETKSEDDINIASNKPVINEATKKNKMSNKKRHNRKDVIDNSTMGISVNTTKIGIEDSAKTNGGRDINQNPSISIHHEVGMFKDSVHAESEDKSGVRATKEGKDEAHILLSDEVKANSYSNEIKTKKRKHSKPQSTRIPKSGRKTGIESVKGSDNKHSQKSTVTKNNLNHQKEVSRKNDSKNDTKSTVWTEKTSIKQDEIRRKEALHSERKDNMLKTDGSKNVSQGSTDVETYSNDKNNKKHSDKVNPGKYRRLQSRRNSRRQRKGKHAKKKESVITSAAINDDRWSRPGLIQVPDVKRLERRLHPTVEAPVSDIITSFRKILHQMQHSIYLIDFDYKHTFNVTRWSIMTGVRDELLNIAKENDNVYDAVMDASLHTKELYMRAHQRKRFGDVQALTMGPIRDRSGPRSIDLRSKYQYARDEMRSAQLLKRKIRDLQRLRGTLRYDYIELTRKISEKLPTRSLYDLFRRVNQTIETLEYTRAMRDAIDKGHYYRHSQKSTYHDMRIARDFIRDAQETMEIVNQQYSNNHLKAKEIKKARVTRYRNTSSDLDILHMERWASADRAKLYANKLFNTAAMILMKFKPVLQQSDLIIVKLKNGTLETKFERDVRNIREKLQELNTTMFGVKAGVCTDMYEACIPKVEELDTEEIDKIEASGADSDDTEDEEEEHEKQDTDQTTPLTTTRKTVTDSIDGITKLIVPNKTISASGTSFKGTTNKPTNVAEIDIDVDTESDDDSEEIYFSSGDDLLVESSGDKIEISTEDGANMNITKLDSSDTHVHNTHIEPTEKTTIKLPDTDDEDIFEEMKRTKKTTTPTIKTIQISTTEAPEKTEPPVEEEEEEEGGWWWLDDPFGLIQDQMFGGSNTRRKRDTSESDVKLSNITLTELIQQHLKNRSGVNKDLLKKARQRLQSLEDLKRNLTLIQTKIDRCENYTNEVKGFTHKWKAKSVEFRTVHERVMDISKDVKFKEEVFGEQIEKAVKKAESKLQRMQEIYEKNKDRVTDTSGPDNAIAALQLANKVKDNLAEIVNIKKFNPTPCKTLEMMDNAMRANISVLRQKIRQAKLITASLKVAVSLDGTSHLALPVSPRDQNKQSQLHVEMMVKSNSDKGAIAVVQTNNMGAMAISLKDYLPTITLYDGGKYKIEEEQGESPLYNDTWYRIFLKRFGTAYNFTVYNGSSLVQSFLTQVDGDDYPTVYNQPSSVFIGGANDDYYLDDWKGCVGDIRINGEFLNVHADSKSRVPKSCTLIGNTLTPENSLILDGDSYAFYKLNNRQLRSRVKQFAMNFTAQSDGFVSGIKAENNRFQAVVFIKERKLHVKLKHHSYRATFTSIDDVTGIKQRLEILSNGRSLEVYMNSRKEGFTKTDTFDETQTTGRANIDIYLGIAGNTSSIRGCIHGIKLNDENIHINSMFDGENIVYGTCQQKECVTFSNNSKPIQLSDITTATSLSIVFSYGSQGRLLQYTKGKKFNLQILIDGDGLDMKETVKENSESIDLPDSEFIHGDDVVVIITDEEDEMKITVGDESETFSYGSNGGGGFFGFFGIGNGDDSDNDDDDDVSSYDVTIGGNVESSTSFIGNLVSLQIQNEPVDLTSYVTSNNLQRCLMSQTTPVIKTTEKKRTPLTC